MAKLARNVAPYYEGAHRVIMGGVPCRIASLLHYGGKALRRESSRAMAYRFPCMSGGEFIKWEAAQRAKYEAAPKLGPWEPEPALMPAPPMERVSIVPAIVEPVQRPAHSTPAVEPLARRLPSRPMTRHAGRAITAAMRTVHYYRVSTARQGRSGLGLKAQRAAVEAFCASRGCEPIAEYVEVESGKNDARPELAKALHHAKVTGATVIVGKLDRLSRNVAFLAQLQDAGVRFLAADMPEANEMVVGIMAVMAQAERKAISTRTKEAMAAAKARGTKLGNPLGYAAFGPDQNNHAAVAAIKDRSRAFAADIIPIIEAIKADGHTSLRAIAAELNARGIMTARRGQWGPSMVREVITKAP